METIHEEKLKRLEQIKNYRRLFALGESEIDWLINEIDQAYKQIESLEKRRRD